jgi:hypothetical protein
MRNHYKEVLKDYEEGKEYCDEVIVSENFSSKKEGFS